MIPLRSCPKSVASSFSSWSKGCFKRSSLISLIKWIRHFGMFQSPVDSFSEPPGGSRMVIENRIVMIRHHPTANQRLYDEVWFAGISRTLIGSRALAAYGDVDGPSAANN